MRAVLFLASITAFGAACGNPSNNPGSPDMATDELPANALTVQIGPFDIASGQEIVKCSVMKMPNTADIDVVRLQTTLAPGSHHLVLYRSAETMERAAYDCTSFEGVNNNEAPVFIAESAMSDMKLPTGVAYHFKANQMVRLEAHYINTQQQTIHALGKVALVPGQPGVTYQPADMMMCGSVGALSCEFGGGLQPGDPNYKLPVGFYHGHGISLRGQAMDVDLTKLKIFAFTSHEHHRGTDVKIWRSQSTDVSNSELLYDNTSWDNPPLKVLPDDKLLQFGANEGFAWQCAYDTSADTKNVCFGESANDEMCFIWAYYFPSVGRFIAQDDCWVN